MNDRVLPQDLNLERTILATCVLFGSSYLVAADMLKPEHFYASANAHIWQSMARCSGSDGSVDHVRLYGLLSAQEQGILAEIEDVSTVADIAPHCHRLIELWQLRELIRTCQQVQNSAYNHSESGQEPRKIISDASMAIYSLERHESKRTYRSSEEIVRMAMDDLEMARQGRAGGLLTGFKKLDSLLTGLYPGDFVIVGGRPGMGKTAFAMNVAGNIARAGGVVFMASLEMPDKQILLREMCGLSGVPMHSVRAGKISNEQYLSLARVAGDVAELPIFIDDRPRQTPLDIYTRARRVKSQAGKLSIVIVDHFALMGFQGRHRDRLSGYTENSNSMKAMAKELDCPVMVLSQVSREIEKERKNKRPLCSDLKECGSLEQDADIIMFPFRPDVYDSDPSLTGQAEIIVGKHRNGPVGTVYCGYDNRLMRFTDSPSF